MAGMTRRQFLQLGAGGVAAGAFMSAPRLARAAGLSTSQLAAAQSAAVSGLPVFTGTGAPAEPVPFHLNGMMQAIHDAGLRSGTFWVDDMLARNGGGDPAPLNLLSRGRAALMRSFDVAWGFAGDLSYIHSLGRGNAYVLVSDIGFDEQPSQRVNAPSHYKSVWTNDGVTATQHNFITWNDALVTTIELRNSGTATRNYTVTLSSPYAATAQSDELLGTVQAWADLATIDVRLSGTGFTADGGQLVRTFTIAPGETASATVVMGLVTDGTPEAALDYEVYRSLDPAAALQKQVVAYNAWWAENIPYIDIPDPYLKKLVYYRWWIARYNALDAELERDYRYPTSFEGSLGYDNAISNSIDLQVQETKWLRDPLLAYSSWISLGATSAGGAFIDNPGGQYWHRVFNQYTTAAGLDALNVHGADEYLLRLVAGYGRDDVNGLLATQTSGGVDLIEYSTPTPTGLDGDAISFFYYGDGRALRRVETAYVWWNAVSSAALWGAVGEKQAAEALGSSAASMREAILGRLWSTEAGAFLHQDVQTGNLIPWKSVQNYLPYSAGLVPDAPEYLAAFKYWTEPGHFLLFPPYSSDQTDLAACIAAGNAPTDNFAEYSTTLDLNFLSRTLRTYRQSGLGPQDYKRLLYWGGWLEFWGGSADWPDANEYLHSWNASTDQIDFRSAINHDFLGNYNWAIIEDIGGLRPRADDVIELDPIDIGWEHFVLDQVPYHGHDLTIAWVKPGSASIGELPPGYSLYVDGDLAFTVDALAPVTWRSSTGKMDTPAGVTVRRALPVASRSQVPLRGRVLEQFAKAGAGSGAWWTLRNAGSGGVLGVDGGALTPGSVLDCGPDTGAAAQRWRLIDQRNGTVVLKNFASRQLLTLRDGQVVQEPETAAERAESGWRVDDRGDGTVLLRCDAGVLTVSGGGLTISQEDGGAAQRWQFVPTGAVKLQNANSNKLLAAPAMTNLATGSGVTPTASYTHPGDTLDGPLVNSTGASTPRWTCWNSMHPTDWYQVSFGQAVTIDRLLLNFYDDAGGVQPPTQYVVQTMAGGSWVDVGTPSTYPEIPTQGPNIVAFDPVQTTAIRVVFTNRNPVNFGTYTGLTELQAYAASSAQDRPATQQSDDGAVSHLWRFDEAGGAAFRVVSVAQGGSVAAAGPTAIVAPEGLTWRLQYAGDGYFHLVSGHGHALGTRPHDLEAGAAVVVTGSTHQLTSCWAVGTPWS